VSIAPDVEIFTGGEHHTEWVTTYPLRIMLDLPGANEDGHPASRGDVTIGSDVWIGAGVKVMSGTTIGDGAVLGAGAVVTGTVRPYAVVAGIPAREVRRRFTDEQVEALLSIRWWDWTDREIAARVDELCAPNVSAFVQKYKRAADAPVD
jgi:acetyltransferase-like isoleucine patch superfamily enzyme